MVRAEKNFEKENLDCDYMKSMQIYFTLVSNRKLAPSP